MDGPGQSESEDQQAAPTTPPPPSIPQQQNPDAPRAVASDMARLAAASLMTATIADTATNAAGDDVAAAETQSANPGTARVATPPSSHPSRQQPVADASSNRQSSDAPSMLSPNPPATGPSQPVDREASGLRWTDPMTVHGNAPGVQAQPANGLHSSLNSSRNNTCSIRIRSTILNHNTRQRQSPCPCPHPRRRRRRRRRRESIRITGRRIPSRNRNRNRNRTRIHTSIRRMPMPMPMGLRLRRRRTFNSRPHTRTRTRKFLTSINNTNNTISTIIINNRHRRPRLERPWRRCHPCTIRTRLSSILIINPNPNPC
ncbi:hypothetical protein C8A01DRAFT_38414 [Parachaetomium inaequale]|uniref:Uncharacterized protein n=1 Tax=Parachaetomium inaequale TaxID=2588326 RepID=A0AAN6SPN8_9PEZI|nr:hypothetical protein C8A01DRAFT_38414 [Parachaetomium inaequale]